MQTLVVLPCRRSGICIIALAAFLFSISTLGVKVLTQAGVPAFQVAAIPAAACLLGTSLLVRGRGLQLLAGNQNTKWLTTARGLLGAGSLVLYYVSIGGGSKLCCNAVACAAREHRL
jgi:drug/metabolite transporter (DMT)-like permease